MAYNHRHHEQWPPLKLRREENNVTDKQATRRQGVTYEHAKHLIPPSKDEAYNSKLQRPQKARTVQSKWAVGGPGTQAIFLKTSPNSSPRPTGTGVFIPRRAGAKLFNDKPAFAPVLLPARVVQVLNLNVHELIGNHRITKGKKDDHLAKKVDEEIKTTKDDDMNYLSPELLLPEEWVYE